MVASLLLVLVIGVAGAEHVAGVLFWMVIAICVVLAVLLGRAVFGGFWAGFYAGDNSDRT